MSAFEITSSPNVPGGQPSGWAGCHFFWKKKKRRRTTSGVGVSLQEITRTIGLGNSGTKTVHQKPSRKNKKKNTSIWRTILMIGAVLVLLGALGLGFLFLRAYTALPPWDPEKLSSATNSLLYDAQENLIYELHSGENRREVTLDQVPEDLIQALLATEDRNFYSHHGIDIRGILRSLLANVTSREITQGASTITQQLARNSYLTLEKTMDRKLKEIILAFKIESSFSKDEILTFYLNKMNFGAGAYGVQAASYTYFGKDVSELNLPQCALLVGLLQAPSAYNPLLYYDKAKARQEIVLNNMAAVGYISEEEAQEAMAADLELLTEEESSAQNLQNSNLNASYGYYVDAVIEEAIEILSEELNIDSPESAIYSGGLSIYTNLEPKIQNQMNAVYADDSYFQTITYQGLPVQSASVVVENTTGKVVALIGGREYQTARGFNRATQALRQPGSCIKPLTVYSPALESGVMPFQIYEDAPISYYLSDGSYWSPQNYDLTYRGYITMRTAVQWSVNTYAVQLLDDIGVRTGFDYGRSLGLPLVDTPGANELGLAPLAFGGLTHGVTPLQMAGAYAALGNQGIYNEPYLISRIYDEDGALIYSYEEHPSQVFSPETAWLMTSMLQTVTSSGTGTPGKVPNVPTAGKTGTSEEKSNAWFCGYTPKYACAVWFGFDEVHAMPGVYGSDAARIFRSILTAAHEGIEAGSFDAYRPSDIISVSICRYDGKLIAANTPEDAIITEYCVSQYAPTEYSDAYVDVEVCANTNLLPSAYCPTVTMAFRRNATPSEVCSSCQMEEPPSDFIIMDPLIDNPSDLLPTNGENPNDATNVPNASDTESDPFYPLDFSEEIPTDIPEDLTQIQP